MTYLDDKEFLLALDNEQHRTHYARIQIHNPFDGWHDGEYIEGIITNGNITINGSSAMRRSGSLTMIADDTNYKITDVDNIISINKQIKIEIGLENHIDSTYPDIIWFKLGTFVISSASITHGLSGININISLKDLTALLNGECGGTLPGGITHSPIIDENGNKEPVPYYDLIESLLLEYTEIPKEDIYIDIKGDNSSLFEDSKGNLLLKNTVRWTSSTPIYSQYIGKVPPENSGIEIYNLTLTKPESENTDEYNFNDNIGYQLTEFVYPMKSDLTSNAGESVASVLDKIKSSLGNFEYFFDVNGKFHFQEIDNGINQGSAKDNWEEALGDGYLPNQIKDESKIRYSFNNSNLAISYSNSPQYSMIKNDLVMWGVRGDGKLPLRYRLVIDYKPEIPIGVSYTGYVYTDEFGVKRISPLKKGQEESISITPTDWRQYLYLDYVIGGNRNDYDKELKEELPKIMDIETGEFYVASANENDVKLKLNSMVYFIDMIDPNDNAFDDKPEIKKILKGLTVTKIGRRTKSLSDSNVNTLFNPSFPDVAYIEVGKENTAEQRQIAIANKMSFIQVPSYLANNIAIGSAINSAYDAIRSMLHEVLSYNEAISLSAIPVYYLDANQIIQVVDDDSGINGNYLINSISIPLAVNGNMSISAKTALNRI